jgi:mannose-6-phosphate isomerase
LFFIKKNIYNEYKYLSGDSKEIVFDKIRSELDKDNLNIINEDQTCPWGGFLVIDEDQISDFVSLFFLI